VTAASSRSAATAGMAGGGARMLTAIWHLKAKGGSAGLQVCRAELYGY